MNIFYLDQDPKLCAQYHADKHVIKMILESAQLLCTAIRITGGVETNIISPEGANIKVWLLPDESYYFKKHKETVPKVDDYGFNIPGEFMTIIRYDLILSSGLYKSTHINHPCSVWIRESYHNWVYVLRLMFYLEKEWLYRYQHTKRHKKWHKSAQLLIDSGVVNLAANYLPLDKPFTQPALAMPVTYQIPNDPIASYRNYYANAKSHLHTWTHRDTPSWIADYQ